MEECGRAFGIVQSRLTNVAMTRVPVRRDVKTITNNFAETSSVADLPRRPHQRMATRRQNYSIHHVHRAHGFRPASVTARRVTVIGIRDRAHVISSVTVRHTRTLWELENALVRMWNASSQASGTTSCP